jgi:hypothetical protein
MLSQSLWSALGPLVVHARLQLLHLLDAHAYSLVFDVAFAVFFAALSATLWCCCLRSAQDVTLALLKIFAYVAIGAVATNVALHLVSIAAHEHEQVGAAINATAAFARHQVRALNLF